MGLKSPVSGSTSSPEEPDSAATSPRVGYQRWTALYFLATSLGCQAISFGAVLYLQQLGGDLFRPEALNPAAVLIIAGILQAGCAYTLARFLKLPVIWQIFNLAIFPAITISQHLHLSSAVLAGLVLISALVYLPTFWTRVPFYPTHQSTYALVAAEIPEHQPVKVVDLGSGFGRLLFYLARTRPNAQIVGVEVSLLPLLYSWFRKKLGGYRNVSIQARSLWSFDLSDFDLVYAFLAPDPMVPLWHKVHRELKPGAKFISNSFPAPADPYAIRDTGIERGGVLYIYCPNQQPKTSDISIN